MKGVHIFMYLLLRSADENKNDIWRREQRPGFYETVCELIESL